MNLAVIKQHLEDRMYLLSVVLLIGLTLVILVLSAINIQVGELRVPIRYSAFDEKNYTLDQWYYLLSFPLFAVVVAGFHTALSFKLYEIKGRLFALTATYLGSIVLVFALVVFLSIYRVVSIS